MAGRELTAAIDQVSRAQSKGFAALRQAAGVVETVEHALGMRFSPGDRVVDLVTGEQGEIIGGQTIDRHV